MCGQVTADAKDLLYDVGYVSTGVEAVDSLPCPPNFARYINSICVHDASKINGHSLDRGLDDRRFNVSFEFDPCGRTEVWVRSTRYIKAGEEILVDYGGKHIDVRINIFDATLMHSDVSLPLHEQPFALRRYFSRKEAKVGK